jgi:phenylpyruvate tautomerase PptA (4-oxalocrotonate tautomerase family)
MPHIRIRGMTTEQVRQLSEKLGEELAPIIQTSADNFTVEHVETRFFTDGKANGGYPFIEVFWFARDAAIKQKTAEHLTARAKDLAPEFDVAVVFQPIDPANYFENGTHF